MAVAQPVSVRRRAPCHRNACVPRTQPEHCGPPGRGSGALELPSHRSHVPSIPLPLAFPGQLRALWEQQCRKMIYGPCERRLNFWNHVGEKAPGYVHRVSGDAFPPAAPTEDVCSSILTEPTRCCVELPWFSPCQSMPYLGGPSLQRDISDLLVLPSVKMLRDQMPTLSFESCCDSTYVLKTGIISFLCSFS
jgi:hypothetical protein